MKTILSPWLGLLSLAGVAAAVYGLARVYSRALDVAPDLQFGDDDFALQPLAGAADPAPPA